jgi:hypothetical protein
VILFAIQVAFPSNHVQVPVVAAVGCFALATIWGVLMGPNAVRLAILLWWASFISVAVGILMIYSQTPGSTRSGPSINEIAIALGATFAVLALTQSIRASLAERAASRGWSGPST